MVSNEIPFYIQILKSELERRNRTGRYSLRSFARDIDISPSALSEIIRQKKGMAEDTATRIAFLFKLRHRERQLFINSSILFRIKNKKKKDEIEKRVNELVQQKQSRKFESVDLSRANTWKHTAIIELMSFPDYDGSIEWLSRKLKVNMASVQFYLESLEKIKLVEKENNKYRRNLSFIESTDDQPFESIKGYHKSVLTKAIEALEAQNVSKREFQTLTLAFDREDMSRAIDTIRMFMDQFTETFCCDQKNSIYQLSVNFIDLA